MNRLQSLRRSNTMANTRHKGSGFAEADDAARTVGSQIRETAESFGEKAESAASTATEKAKGAASYVSDKAGQATEAVGCGMESLGGAIREHTPHSGMLGNASECVASKLESAGQYLEQEGLQGLGQDVTNLIRRNPIPALLVGVGLGFLMARMGRR